MNTDAPLSGRKHPLIRFLRNLVIGVLTIYLCVILFLVFSETRLVFPGIDKDRGKSGNWEPDFEFEEVWLDSADGFKIHGWFLTKTDASRSVLLFHGNAEDVPHVAERYARRVGEAIDANVLVYDYRGFGKSTGSPNESNTIDDGELMLDWLIDRSKSSGAQEIIYYGSSLGGGVAVGLAERRTPAHLVLDRTFDALTSPGAEQYPWIPVKLIMRNRFDSASRIADIDAPLFQSHNTNDQLCKIKFARRLFKQAKTTDKEFYELPEGGHFDNLPDHYWQKLQSYFEAREISKGENDSE